jgi:alpha/beta hydrolase fold
MAKVRALPAAVTVVLALFAASCSSDDEAGSTTPTTTTTTAVASTTTTAAGAPTTEMVDIGGGRELYLECRGEGSPTILLEAGDESDTSQWRKVVDDLAEETKTCAYDRVGNGRSSPAEGCRGLDDILADTEALIEASDLPGPYVFVGTSGGGFLAAEMAARHPEQTAGLVLVETPKAITILPPEIAAQIACGAPTNVEHRDYVGVEHAVWDDRQEIGDFPMVIFSNDFGSVAVDDQVTNVEDQQGWLILSPNSKQIVVDSGHDVAVNEPELVVAEILGVLEAARAS